MSDQIDQIAPCKVTYGVDMSTNPKKTGLVAIRWDGAQPGVITEASVGVTIGKLVERISSAAEEAAVWAVDVPFGWPDGFADFLTRHRDGPAGLDPDDLPDLRPWARISHRATDRVARRAVADAGGKNGGAGINVSFDKLGATAAAWSVVEYGLFQKQIRLDRSGRTGRVVETYPAAAWRVWRLGSSPAAKSTWAATLERLTSEGIIDVGARADALARNEHIRDALACALVGRARALGLTSGPGRHEELARYEGWIHLPRPQSLGDLPGPRLELPTEPRHPLTYRP